MQQLSRAEKILELEKEFESIQIFEEDYLSASDFFHCLDILSNYTFDSNIAAELYDQMDKNYEGKVSRMEIIKIFLDAEEILQSKIERCRKSISQQILKKRTALVRLNEMKNLQKYIDKSELTITVKEASLIRENHENQNLKYYCLINLADEIKQTNEICSNYPNWNQKFNFYPVTGKEVLEIKLLNKETNSDNILGSVSITLNRLEDQMKHDEWFELEKFGNLTGIRIHLKVKWVYSKEKLFIELIKRLDENLKLLKSDFIQHQKDLENLMSPFRNITKLKKKEAETINLDIYDIQKLCIDKFALVISIFISFIALFVSFNRSVYLDLIIVGFFITFHHFNKLDGYKLKYMGLLFIMSIIIDISWLWVYNNNWWENNENLNMTKTYRYKEANKQLLRLNNIFTPQLEQDLLRFVLIFSYFLIILKSIAVLTYFIESCKYNGQPKIDPKELDINDFSFQNELNKL